MQVREDHDLSDKLHKVLTELESCYQTLLETQRDKLGESFNESTDSLNQLRARLVARFEGIEEHPINKKENKIINLFFIKPIFIYQILN